MQMLEYIMTLMSLALEELQGPRTAKRFRTA